MAKYSATCVCLARDRKDELTRRVRSFDTLGPEHRVRDWHRG